MSTCVTGIARKYTRKSLGKPPRVEFPLQIVHSDVCGPFSVRARHGAQHSITFTNDYTYYGFVYLISYKYEGISCFIYFLDFIENQLD